MQKNILLSKTFWLNLLLALSPLLPGVGEWLASHMELVASIWGGLNIVLRLISKDKVTLLP